MKVVMGVQTVSNFFKKKKQNSLIYLKLFNQWFMLRFSMIFNFIYIYIIFSKAILKPICWYFLKPIFITDASHMDVISSL